MWPPTTKNTHISSSRALQHIHIQRQLGLSKHLYPYSIKPGVHTYKTQTHIYNKHTLAFPHKHIHCTNSISHKHIFICTPLSSTLTYSNAHNHRVHIYYLAHRVCVYKHKVCIIWNTKYKVRVPMWIKIRNFAERRTKECILNSNCLNSSSTSHNPWFKSSVLPLTISHTHEFLWHPKCSSTPSYKLINVPWDNSPCWGLYHVFPPNIINHLTTRFSKLFNIDHFNDLASTYVFIDWSSMRGLASISYTF